MRIGVQCPSIAQLVRARSLYLRGPRFESWWTDSKHQIRVSAENICTHISPRSYVRVTDSVCFVITLEQAHLVLAGPAGALLGSDCFFFAE